MEIAGNIRSSVFEFEQLSDNQFRKLSTYIFKNFGIKMPEEKRIILQCRLQKRLRDLQLNSFKDYVDYVFSEDGQLKEVRPMMDLVSTNKTDFYRESDHFELLADSVLSDILDDPAFRLPMKIWSAGCSSGEEAYTIAFTLEEYRENIKYFDYKIYGSDISERIISRATEAIYPEDKIHAVSDTIKKKYMLKSKDRINPTVRIRPDIRNKMLFRRENLMQEKFSVPDNLDVIFCRNVLIYFNRPTQEIVLKKLIARLRDGGFLFLGHSESITNMNLPLAKVATTVFKKY